MSVTTAEFAQKSVIDVIGVVPLIRDSALGRALVDVELVLVLFGLAALVAIKLDRPDREQRSVAELLALTGAIVAAGALLVVPGLAGHAGQTSPAALSLALDWTHLVAGSLWLGGLVAVTLTVARTPPEARLRVLGDAVPRFSLVALASVIVLIASGTGSAIVHLPTLAVALADLLWEGDPGQDRHPGDNDPGRRRQQPAVGAAPEGRAGSRGFRIGVGRDRPAAAGGGRRDRAGHCHRAGGDGAHQPAAAGEGAGGDRHGRRSCRPGSGYDHSRSRLVPGDHHHRSQQGCGAQQVRAAADPRRHTRPGCDRDPAVPDARHGDGDAELRDA